MYHSSQAGENKEAYKENNLASNNLNSVSWWWLLLQWKSAWDKWIKTKIPIKIKTSKSTLNHSSTWIGIALPRAVEVMHSPSKEQERVCSRWEELGALCVSGSSRTSPDLSLISPYHPTVWNDLCAVEFTVHYAGVSVYLKSRDKKEPIKITLQFSD